MDERSKQIVGECQRLEESCKYTQASLYFWLKSLRFWRMVFIILPIIAGSIATARIFVKDSSFDWLTSGAAVIAGLFPLILKGIDLDGTIKSVTECASQFTILKDRFRQAALIGPTGDSDALKADFDALMAKFDKVREVCPAIPERHFKAAQRKVNGGHYKFD